MGWLGWEPAVCLSTEVALIEGALETRSDLLSLIFGTGKKKPPKGKKGKAQVSAFKSFAQRHNGSRKNG